MKTVFTGLRQAVKNSADGVAHLVDPDTNEQFVVMSAESYQMQVRRVFDIDGMPPAETVDAVMQSDDQHDRFLERYQEEHAGQ